MILARLTGFNLELDFILNIVYNSDVGSGEYTLGDVNDHQTRKTGAFPKDAL